MLGLVLVTFFLIAIGELIGVNDQENVANNVYSDNFRTLFGGVNKTLTMDLTKLDSFTNVTDISAASGEDGTFQEYKIANKVDSNKVNIWDQGTTVISSFFKFSNLSLLQKLLLAIISISLVISAIEFFRRYKL